MIQAVLFDFGNVIGFFDHRRATRRFAPLSRLGEDEMYSIIYDGELEHRFESGMMAGDEFIAEVIGLIGYRGEPAQFRADFVEIFTRNPPVIGLIPRLKSRYRLVLASNTNPLHSAHFRVTFADVLQHFDALGMSFEAKVRKPAPGFFLHCFKLAGCQPEECVFIDDIEANVDGARAVGAQTVHYHPTTDLAAELTRLGVTLDASTPR